MAAAGLYDPSFEHDACGVGFVADLSGRGADKWRRRVHIPRAVDPAGVRTDVVHTQHPLMPEPPQPNMKIEISARTLVCVIARLVA